MNKKILAMIALVFLLLVSISVLAEITPGEFYSFTQKAVAERDAAFMNAIKEVADNDQLSDQAKLARLKEMENSGIPITPKVAKALEDSIDDAGGEAAAATVTHADLAPYEGNAWYFAGGGVGILAIAGIVWLLMNKGILKRKGKPAAGTQGMEDIEKGGEAPEEEVGLIKRSELAIGQHTSSLVKNFKDEMSTLKVARDKLQEFFDVLHESKRKGTLVTGEIIDAAGDYENDIKKALNELRRMNSIDADLALQIAKDIKNLLNQVEGVSGMSGLPTDTIEKHFNDIEVALQNIAYQTNVQKPKINNILISTRQGLAKIERLCQEAQALIKEEIGIYKDLAENRAKSITFKAELEKLEALKEKFARLETIIAQKREQVEEIISHVTELHTAITVYEKEVIAARKNIAEEKNKQKEEERPPQEGEVSIFQKAS